MWERYYPTAAGVFVAIGWLLFGYKIACYAEVHKWHFDQIYIAFFGFASITTGFLATFYGTVQSMSTGFIQRIRGTRALTGFLRLSKKAIIMGFVGCVVTVPMLIIQPIPTEPYSFWAFGVALWMGISVWAIAGFWRVASLLFLLFETSDKGNRPAG
jgi:hypothetical protein